MTLCKTELIAWTENAAAAVFAYDLLLCVGFALLLGGGQGLWWGMAGMKLAQANTLPARLGLTDFGPLTVFA